MSQGFLWPVRREDLARSTAAGQYTLRVTMAGVTEDLTFPPSALTADRNYWASNDAQADTDGGVGGVGDFLALLRATLLTHSQAVGVTLSLSSINVLTINTGLVLTSILWGNAATTLAAAPFGFAQTDTGTAGVLTGAVQTRGACTPTATWTETDSRPIRARKLSVARSLSDRVRIAVHSTGRDRRRLRFALLQPYEALIEYVASGAPTMPTGSFEHMLELALGLGRPVRFYEELSTRTSTSYWLGKLFDAYASREDLIERNARYPAARWDAAFNLVAV